ncbi:hypothetical protein TRFO_30091 [Tritrichomonas foetus]|uniref:LIM zinc-binding domain-containing protein n=1 Tax=Tritrichomonas foetus TaxID=1144522 RepID=A0A1J4JZ00_9EUKA|nr:hypothetical protein TRFO_30091 [Tritrichomonas foetus]|eukprot:OHT02726.1 hypothetical protein TRFO_30091 [Tritrichomonas foetus]
MIVFLHSKFNQNMNSKIDPYALPDPIIHSISDELFKNYDTELNDPEKTNQVESTLPILKIDSNPQTKLNVSHENLPQFSNIKSSPPNFDGKRVRRVSFSNEMGQINQMMENFNPSIIDKNLDNLLPSGTFPDIGITLKSGSFGDFSQNDNSNIVRENLSFDSLGVEPTNLESLPEFVPNSIPLTSLDFNDPTVLPDLPRLPVFNIDTNNQNNENSNNKNELNKGNAGVLRFSNRPGTDLTSVTDIMISGDFNDSSLLPQIPSQNSDLMLIAPELGSISSSGNLPNIVPRTDFGHVDVNGLSQRNCKICDRPVEFDGLFANGDYFHRTCAKCPHCGIQLAPPKCVLFKEKLYCVSCAEMKCELKKCSICNLPLDGFQKELTLSKINQTIHTNCLCCYECSRNLAKGQQEILEDKILCRRCASCAKQRICAKCNQYIVGNFVHCHKKYYHPDHFTCLICNKIIFGNDYKIHHNRIFCSTHSSYFQQHCSYCKRALYLTDEMLLKWKGKLFHKVCFVCRVCGCDLLPEHTKSFHSRPHCEECFKRRKSESSTGFGSQTKKHIPEVAQERRIRYMNDGVKIVMPVYETKNQFLENVEVDDIDDDFHEMKLTAFEKVKLAD